MKVFHTSTVRISKPDTSHSRNFLDFGRGFYVTALEEQARQYGKRFAKLGLDIFLHTFEYTPSEKFKIKRFHHYDKEWLDFVCSCRKGDTKYLAFDIIEGGVANDRVFRTVDFYMAGIFTLEQALQQLSYEKPNHQICFIKQSAIDECLTLIDCIKLN